MNIETERLVITELTMEMAAEIQRQSLDAATRRFVPDEVFETLEAAQETVRALIEAYQSPDGPYVYMVGQRCPLQISTPSRAFGPPSVVGYVQLCRIDEGWEIGYHIGEAYRGQAYASESVRAFLPVMMARLGIDRVWGIVDEENIASCRVLEKCGFALVGQGARRRYLYKT